MKGKVITSFLKLKYTRKKRMNKNIVNKYSMAGYIPGILAIIQDINVCLLVCDIKYKIEVHKTSILRVCFCTDVKLGPLPYKNIGTYIKGVCVRTGCKRECI
jgi:hypothetical protein